MSELWDPQGFRPSCKEINNACRSLKSDGESATLQTGAWTVEVQRLDISSIEGNLRTSLEELLRKIADEETMGGSVGVIWSCYVSDEFNSDSDVYFVIVEREG